MTMRQSLALFALFLSACASTPEHALKPGTQWVAHSPEWAAEAREVYAEATKYVVGAATTREAGSWAVALDLDETVLNNVAYQISRERVGEGFTGDSWHEWTQKEKATLVPGAAEFLDAVNAAGGHIAFVTNRRDNEQLATENNLAKLGVRRGEDFQVLLTRATPKGASAKDERYDAVPAILAAQGYPGVKIIAYVGDAKGDKPATPGDWVFFCIDQGAMYGDPCADVPGPGR
jgi:5'-nucleotidase (lipoprotein e(P4) family)